jgi:hypothetical protein
MARAPHRPADPSTDAAALLRRLGFAVLMIGVPNAALLARRGTVLMVPIGVSLLALASLLDGGHRPFRVLFTRLAASSGSVALVLGLLWIAVSLLWTPPGGQAVERSLSLGGTLAALAIGYLALPDRMRSANLYLLPVGVAIAAVLALVLSAGWGGGRSDLDDDGGSLERGLTVLVLFAWPAIAWLRSRERDLEALTLAVLVATASVVIGARTPLPIALGIGAIVFALASLWPSGTATGLAFVMALLMATAPFAWLPLSSLAAASGPSAPLIDGLNAWRAVVTSDPLRLLTGHGFGTFQYGRITGLVPPGTPGSAPFQIWYDLGVVGALAAVAVLWSAPRAAVTSYAALSSGVAGAFGAGFALALFGFGGGQMWLLTALGGLVLTFVASERGQFRTERPRALVFRTAREPT